MAGQRQQGRVTRRSLPLLFYCSSNSTPCHKSNPLSFLPTVPASNPLLFNWTPLIVPTYARYILIFFPSWIHTRGIMSHCRSFTSLIQQIQISLLSSPYSDLHEVAYFL